MLQVQKHPTHITQISSQTVSTAKLAVQCPCQVVLNN